mmetsp:Transcript_36703/g.117930  ORF Transcript_36703/g.117930 Transcript_36703/m.117930 type:complete len:284 (-) Transcript_36703:1133-1984(-)
MARPGGGKKPSVLAGASWETLAEQMVRPSPAAAAMASGVLGRLEVASLSSWAAAAAGVSGTLKVSRTRHRAFPRRGYMLPGSWSVPLTTHTCARGSMRAMGAADGPRISSQTLIEGITRMARRRVHARAMPARPVAGAAGAPRARPASWITPCHGTTCGGAVGCTSPSPPARCHGVYLSDPGRSRPTRRGHSLRNGTRPSSPQAECPWDPAGIGYRGLCWAECLVQAKLKSPPLWRRRRRMRARTSRVEHELRRPDNQSWYSYVRTCIAAVVGTAIARWQVPR